MAQPHRTAAAVALGLATLTKGLPPVVLFLPVLALDYRNWRRWLLSWPIVAFIAVALPWYVLCTLRNGWSFPRVFFVEHQFGRFLTPALKHPQPWYFYGPVFLLLLFPWFPLLPAAVRHARADARTRLLAAVVAAGILFFSLSVNKLPGYILPLIPATCALMGVALANSSHRERWLIAPIGVLGALPVAISILPASAAHGLHTATIPWTLAAAQGLSRRHGLSVAPSLSGFGHGLSYSRSCCPPPGSCGWKSSFFPLWTAGVASWPGSAGVK